MGFSREVAAHTRVSAMLHATRGHSCDAAEHAGRQSHGTFRTCGADIENHRLKCMVHQMIGHRSCILGSNATLRGGLDFTAKLGPSTLIAACDTSEPN